MTAIPQVTYKQIVDKIVADIKSSCINISNFASISSVFKSGYSQTITISGGNDAARCYCTVTISGNNIVEVSAGTVDANMNSFLSTIGINSYINDYIKPSEFIKFLNDMITFCSTKLAYSTSQYAQSTKYLIYNSSNSSYVSPETILSGVDIKEIDLYDTSSIVNIVINSAKQNARNITCKYAYNYS